MRSSTLQLPIGSTSCRVPALRYRNHNKLQILPWSTRSAQVTEQETSYGWTGSDQFSDLNDRKDLSPLKLPTIDITKRVVLVRHGQSTWNAEGRIQGSSDFAQLTTKGMAQAETTRDMVSKSNAACVRDHGNTRGPHR
jgi:hypothetical protein